MKGEQRHGLWQAVAVKDGDRAGEVITGSRALPSRSSVAHRPCDLAGVIRDVLLLVGPELRRHGPVLQTSLATDLPPFVGDRVQLQQVPLSLLLNTLEAVRPPRSTLLCLGCHPQNENGRWAR
jgi:C4-dicarboxylate-specific signal transduction histidine kinase